MENGWHTLFDFSLFKLDLVPFWINTLAELLLFVAIFSKSPLRILLIMNFVVESLGVRCVKCCLACCFSMTYFWNEELWGLRWADGGDACGSCSLDVLGAFWFWFCVCGCCGLFWEWLVEFVTTYNENWNENYF